MSRINKEIAMVVIVVLIVLIVSGFVFFHVESMRGLDDIPDTDDHEVTGKIVNYSGVWYKFVNVYFDNGSEITFDGRGIWDAIANLELNQTYTFHWKWSTFEMETESGQYYGKWCYRIEDINATVWEPDLPLVQYGLILVLCFLVLLGVIVYVFLTRNDENGGVEEK